MTPAAVTPAGIASIAREIYSGGPMGMRIMQRWRPYICPLELVIECVPAGAYVLDVGCGGGLLLGAMARMQRIRGGVGIDLSVAGIEAASAMARLIKSESGLRFERISPAQPWPEGSFSAVTMVDVLHHVPRARQREVFDKAAKAVRPGGLLIYKDMALTPAWRRCANTAHDLVVAREWVHYVAMATIQEWASAADLVPEQCRQVNRLWYCHQLAVFKRAETG